MMLAVPEFEPAEIVNAPTDFTAGPAMSILMYRIPVTVPVTAPVIKGPGATGEFTDVAVTVAVFGVTVNEAVTGGGGGGPEFPPLPPPPQPVSATALAATRSNAQSVRVGSKTIRQAPLSTHYWLCDLADRGPCADDIQML